MCKYFSSHQIASHCSISLCVPIDLSYVFFTSSSLRKMLCHRVFIIPSVLSTTHLSLELHLCHHRSPAAEWRRKVSYVLKIQVVLVSDMSHDVLCNLMNDIMDWVDGNSKCLRNHLIRCGTCQPIQITSNLQRRPSHCPLCSPGTLPRHLPSPLRDGSLPLGLLPGRDGLQGYGYLNANTDL